MGEGRDSSHDWATERTDVLDQTASDERRRVLRSLHALRGPTEPRTSRCHGQGIHGGEQDSETKERSMMEEFDVTGPSGVPGTAPMGDPGEPRHHHHYTYAFRVIPSLIFAEQDRMFAALACSQGDVARQIWTAAGGSEEDAEEIMVTLVRLLTHDVVVITMPTVRQTPEAIFVGITHPHDRTGDGDESTPLRVFFLETGLSHPMLGEVTSNGTHSTRSQTCPPTLEHFVALLDNVLDA